MFVKFALRRNLIYPLQYIIWSFVREIIHMIIYNIIKFRSPYIYMSLMFLGEIFAGAIMYCYERKKIKTIKEKKKKNILCQLN